MEQLPFKDAMAGYFSRIGRKGGKIGGKRKFPGKTEAANHASSIPTPCTILRRRAGIAALSTRSLPWQAGAPPSYALDRAPRYCIRCSAAFLGVIQNGRTIRKSKGLVEARINP